MLMPAIAQLRNEAEIFVAGRTPGIDYLRPYVNQCHDVERAGWHTLFVEGSDKVPNLPITDVDHVASFIDDPDSKVTDNLQRWFPDASVNMFPIFPPKGKRIHIAFYMAQSLETAGFPINAARSFEHAFKQPLMAKQALHKRKGDMIIHPGSGSKRKNYSPELWLDLIKALNGLQSNGRKKVIVLLGPAEKNLLPFFRKGMDEGKGDVIFCPEKDELLSLLYQTPVYFGHDSGITHLASMLGTPTIALFKNSVVHQWHPLGPRVRVVSREGTRNEFIDDIMKAKMDYMET